MIENTSKKKQIFRIISIMSPTEKSYFRKFSYKYQKEDSAVLSLFSIIEKCLKKSDWKEQDIVSAFRQNHPQNDYTKVKAQLLQALLDTIREYDRKNNETEKIFEHLAYADSLIKRNLFHDATGILLKTIKLAEDAEETELALLARTKAFTYDIYTRNFVLKGVNRTLIAEAGQDIDRIHDRIRVQEAAQQVMHFQKVIGQPRNTDELALLEDIQKNPVFALPYSPRTLTAQIDRAISLSGIYFTRGEAAPVVDVCRDVIDAYNHTEINSRGLIQKYLALYDCFMQGCLLSGNTSLFETYLKKFAGIQPAGMGDRALKKGIEYYNRAMYAIITNNPAQVLDIFQDAKMLLQEPMVPNYRKISLSYYMVMGLFMAEAYKPAQAWINWIKNNRHLGVRADVETAVAVIEMIMLWDTEEYTYLDLSIRKFQDNLVKKDRKFRMEALMARFFRSVVNMQRPKEWKQLLQKTREEAGQIIANDPAERVFTESFDFFSWAEAKLSGKPFREVFYQNHFQPRA